MKRIEGLLDNMKADPDQSTPSPSSEDDYKQSHKKSKKLDSRNNNSEETYSIMESIKNSHLTAEGRFISNNNVSCIFKKMKLLDEKKLSQYGIDIQHNESNDYFHIKKLGSSDDRRTDQIKQLIDLGIIKPDETIANIDDWIWKVAGIDKKLSDRLLKM